MAVNFSLSGAVHPRKVFDNTVPDTGRTYVIDTDNNTLVDVIDHSGSSSLTVTGEVFHTTKSDYYVVSSLYGNNGQAVTQNIGSPTDEYLFEDFQIQPNPSGGTGIVELFHNENYEGGVASDTLITMSGGSGSITNSGVVSSTDLEGNYLVGLKSSNFRVMTVEPTATATGITTGRVTFAAKMGGGTSAGSAAEVAFAFLRQGSSLTSSTYKFVASVGESSTTFRYSLTSNLNFTDGFGGSRVLSVDDTIEYSEQKYSTGAARSGSTQKWFMLEWETQASGVYMGLSFKDYVDGDTVDSISGSLIPLIQSFYSGRANGSNYFTTTSLNPCFVLTSRSNNSDNSGYVAIDCIQLQRLDSLPTTGLNSFSLIMRNSGTTSTNARPRLRNVLVDDGVTSGDIIKTGTNYLITQPNSIVNQAGKGMSGIICNATQDSQLTDFAVAFLEFKGNSTGIKHGVCRFAASVDGTSSRFSKLAFSFLRQGTSHDSNAYTVLLYPNTSTDYKIQLRKGAIYTDLTNDVFSDFGGSTLQTSSTLYTDPTEFIWIEVRWKVSGSETNIQVLTKLGDKSLSTFDTSPGTVDGDLTELFSYTDSSSPYITTTLAPVIVMRGTTTTSSNLYQCELRRSKYDN